ncbi:hypothetical protein SAMN04488056_1219 [Cohaesibacter marisflavi]|uniref:Uncharacterized protein n=1 Tax=Cohaesibacter marisflavi TaxID=655353 RepID=A0A1I5MG76_9HYPH|nr:hypothetical protein SAMN04488056_1219 [Cohaesibacter marisflavi]
MYIRSVFWISYVILIFAVIVFCCGLSRLGWGLIGVLFILLIFSRYFNLTNKNR